MRYKLYLITRASAEEIATAVKNIIAILDMATEAKLSAALNTPIKLDINSSATFETTLLAIVSAFANIEGISTFRSEIATKEPSLTKAQMLINDIMRGIPTQYNGVNTNSQFNIDFDCKTIASLLRQMYEPIINLTHNINLSSNAKLNNSNVTAVKDIENAILLKADSHISNTLLIKIKGYGIYTQTVAADLTIPIKPLVVSEMVVEFNTVARILEAISDFICKGTNIAEMKLVPSVFRLTTLYDYANTTLANMDNNTLTVLDLIEIL